MTIGFGWIGESHAPSLPPVKFRVNPQKKQYRLLPNKLGA